MPHVFSVDLEEYFQVTAFASSVSRDQWDGLPSRVEASTDVLLGLLADHGAHATFFTLGWIADRHPGLVRRIAGLGHEIASHGWWHRKVTRCSRSEFESEARDSRAILEDVSGRRVAGFRAPSFSIVPGFEWAFDVLIGAGYAYDSSLFPIRRRGYGYPGANPEPHVVKREAGRIHELPMTTTTFSGLRLPAAGGGYFRQLPYSLTQRALREHEQAGLTGMFYIHPWEIDPEQPRLAVPLVSRLRHYGGLAKTLPRLRRLLGEFQFTSVELAYPHLLAEPAEPLPANA